MSIQWFSMVLNLKINVLTLKTALFADFRQVSGSPSRGLKVVKYPKLDEDAIFETVTLMHSFYFCETLRKCKGNGSGCNLNIPVPYNILDPVPGVYVWLKTTLLGQFLFKNFACYNPFWQFTKVLSSNFINIRLTEIALFAYFAMVHGSVLKYKLKCTFYLKF